MTQRPSPLKQMSLCDFEVSSGTSWTSHGFASSMVSSLPPPPPWTLSPMPDSDRRLTHSWTAAKVMSPLYSSLESALAPETLINVGNFFTLNLLTMADSASFTKPNLIVLRKTCSDDNNLNINGTLSLFENNITFGLVGSVVKNLSIVSAVRTVDISGTSLPMRPESAFFSILPSHMNAGIGLGGYSITEGVVFTLFFSQNLEFSLQSIAHTFIIPLNSLANWLYSSRNFSSSALSAL